MTFAEFVRQAEEIAQPTAKGTENGGHSICCEVEIWTHPHGKRKLQWDVWSSKMNEHYTGDSGETVIMLLREAFGVADIAVHPSCPAFGRRGLVLVETAVYAVLAKMIGQCEDPVHMVNRIVAVGDEYCWVC